MSAVRDDRTTAMGLFNYAHSYWVSAVALSQSQRSCTHKEAPVNYLYYHAIELYLKSFMRLRGFSLNEMKKVGHNMVPLLNETVVLGLPTSNEVKDTLQMIDMNYLQARYIETGLITMATTDRLWVACNFLHSNIEPVINADAGMTRTRAVPS